MTTEEELQLAALVEKEILHEIRQDPEALARRLAAIAIILAHYHVKEYPK